MPARTPDTFEVGPFLFYNRNREDLDRSGRTDVLLASVVFDDATVWFTLPQFGIEFCSEGDALPEVAQQLIAFYSGLRELPSDFKNEVEQIQLDLIERLFLPWLAVQLGRGPNYWTLPPSDTPMVPSDLSTMVPA